MSTYVPVSGVPARTVAFVTSRSGSRGACGPCTRSLRTTRASHSHWTSSRPSGRQPRHCSWPTGGSPPAAPRPAPAIAGHPRRARNPHRHRPAPRAAMGGCVIPDRGRAAGRAHRTPRSARLDLGKPQPSFRDAALQHPVAAFAVVDIPRRRPAVPRGERAGCGHGDAVRRGRRLAAAGGRGDILDRHPGRLRRHSSLRRTARRGDRMARMASSDDAGPAESAPLQPDRGARLGRLAPTAPPARRLRRRAWAQVWRASRCASRAAACSP